MRNLNCGRGAFGFLLLAAFGLFNAAPGSGQVRPDLDEHDRQRDLRFPMDAVLDSLGIRPGMTVAEIGAGWGYLAIKLARRVAPDGTVVAEDINQKWLVTLEKRAAERAVPNIKTLLGREGDPLLPAGEFDLIFMHAVINWIGDRTGFLRKARTALKDDGRFVVIEAESEGEDPGVNIEGPYGFPTRKGYLKLFRRAGLEILSVEKKAGWPWSVFVLKKEPRSNESWTQKLRDFHKRPIHGQ